MQRNTIARHTGQGPYQEGNAGGREGKTFWRRGEPPRFPLPSTGPPSLPLQRLLTLSNPFRRVSLSAKALLPQQAQEEMTASYLAASLPKNKSRPNSLRTAFLFLKQSFPPAPERTPAASPPHQSKVLGREREGFGEGKGNPSPEGFPFPSSILTSLPSCPSLPHEDAGQAHEAASRTRYRARWS